jgi:hypothetical protein
MDARRGDGIGRVQQAVGDPQAVSLPIFDLLFA